MAVSGRKGEPSYKDTIGESCAEDGDAFCHPCSSDDDWVVAVGYCQNCNEHFCATCMKVHRKQSVTKNHVILEGDNMPKAQSASVKLDACSELCDRHDNEILKFYCPSHNAVGCGDCMVLDHKPCQVQRIQDISTTFFNGREHRDLQSKVDKLHEALGHVTKYIHSSEKNMEQAFSKAMNDIKTFRKEINDYLDKVEMEILSEVKTRRQTNEKLMSTLKNDEHTLRQEIAELQEKLRLQANQANELFVSAKRLQGKIAHLDTRIKEMFESTHIMQYAFHQSQKMKEILTSYVPLGELKEKKASIAEMEPEFDSEINLKTTEDKTDCSIQASALLSPNQIVLADYTNQCLKLVDVDQRKLTARYKLSKNPHDLTVISPNLLAVLLARQKIQFLTVTQSNQLTESHDIQAPGCYKIASQNDTVLALFSGSVTIMNTRGNKQKTIALPALQVPMAVAFGTETDTFYVSDSVWDKEVVYKFNLNGTLISKYEDENMEEFRGLTVARDGTCLVCNWEGNGSIHVITPDCKKIKEILRDNKHVKYPWTVSFCDTTSRLFICNNETEQDPQFKNVLKVFQMR